MYLHWYSDSINIYTFQSTMIVLLFKNKLKKYGNPDVFSFAVFLLLSYSLDNFWFRAIFPPLAISLILFFLKKINKFPL